MSKPTTRATARASHPIADEATRRGAQTEPMAANEGASKVTAGYPARDIRTSSTIVAQLWEAAVPNLTRAQLEWFAKSSAEAYESSQRLCHVMAGVGCLIAEDTADGKAGAGNFQEGADVMQLLTAFSEALDGISSMMYVADAARAELLCVSEAAGEVRHD